MSSAVYEMPDAKPRPRPCHWRRRCVRAYLALGIYDEAGARGVRHLRYEPITEYQERGEMRRGIVQSIGEVMRDCDDWRVRADAYDILRQLKVTYESWHIAGGTPPH